MGCDGGTIPTRDELVRLKKKPEQKNKDSERQVKWECCSISQERLREPVVACQLGRLYNKESVLELLIDRTKFSGVTGIDHLKGMKDVKELLLSPNPEYTQQAMKGDGYTDKLSSPYICPVVGIEMNGKYRFSFIWTCGCVLSERALKEVKSDVCHKCGKAYDKDEVIPLNPAEDEIPALLEKLLERRAKAKESKKAKKAMKHKLEDSSSSKGTDSKKKVRMDAEKASDVSKPKASSSKLLPGGVVMDKPYRSVQEDPKASAVFKNLFTSSSEAKKEKSAHWVTYNPQYY